MTDNNNQLLNNLYDAAYEYGLREELGELSRKEFDSGEFGIAYTTYDWTDWRPKADAPVWLKEVYEFFKEIDELDAVPMQLSYNWKEEMYEIWVGSDGGGLPEIVPGAPIQEAIEDLNNLEFDDFCSWATREITGLFDYIG